MTVYCMMAFRRLLGGDEEQKSAEDEDDDEVADVDVCGLGTEEPNTEQIDDVLNVMESLQDDAQKKSTTTTCERSVGATVHNESAASVCSTLNDSDVGQALDAALQNGIDGLLSTISDDQIVCTSSTVITSSESCSTAECLLTTSVLPAVSTDTDQHYLLYSADTEELIDTFLRSTHVVDNDAEPPVSAELTELQAVELTAEDWPVDSLGDDVQMGGMLVEFDSSLLTIIELGNDQTAVDTGTCLAVAPGGGISQVVNGETMAWNVFQGLEVSQFQVVGSEQATEAAVDSLPTPDDGAVDDSPQNTPPGESADGTDGSDASAHSTGPGSTAADDAGDLGDVPIAAVKTDHERAPNSTSTDASDDDEYVLIVDCVDGSDPEVEYEVVDDSDKATYIAAASSGAADQSEVGTDDASDDVATNG